MVVRKQAAYIRSEGKAAILELEGGQELAVARDELGSPVHEGDRFVVHIMPEAEAQLEKEALARTLLNQLLQDDTSHTGQPGSQAETGR